MKKSVVYILIVCMLLTLVLSACSSKHSDTSIREISFADVPSNSPYRDYVAFVCEKGIMEGDDSGFGVNEYISWESAIKYIAKTRSLCVEDEYEFTSSTPEYQTYVDYLKNETGVELPESNIALYLNRAEFAELVVSVIPSSVLIDINSVEDGGIPDVKMSAEHSSSIYTLYRAGVFTGNDDGSFRPNDYITKAECAQALARVAAANLRGSVSLEKPAFSPDLSTVAAADNTFFSDAAIIGNSLVEGLKLYSGLSTLTYYSGTSVSVVSAMTKQVVDIANGSYAKVYIELGINEIGNDVSYFKEQYGLLIDAVRQSQPYADIYIIAILPTSETKSNEGYFTVERVKMYNQALYELANEKECYYIDAYNALVGSDGYLPADMTWDGVHLVPDYYAVWENCIRTHHA